MNISSCVVRALIVFAALPAAGCRHVKEAQVIATVERPRTIERLDTVDTTRLKVDGAGSPEVLRRSLAELIAAHMATVGMVREPLRGDSVIVELPAPGWLLRARLVMLPEQFCQVRLEPLAARPTEHAVEAAPWSVLDAYNRVHLGMISLSPPTTPPIAPERFAQLRSEATAAAAAGNDPPLSPTDYARTPSPIHDQPDAPYYTPSTDSTLQDAP